MPSWRRNRRYILILASASAAMLLLGALFRPRKAEQENAAPAVAQTEIARLQRTVARNSVTGIATFFSELASEIQDQVLWLPGADRTAVIWSSERVVSTSGPTRPPAEDVAEGRSSGPLKVHLTRFGPQRPAALYQVSDAAPLSNRVRYAAAYYEIGVWALVAWRNGPERLEYALGQYLGAATADCDGFTGTQLRLNVDLEPEMVGGAVYDSNGAYMGMVTDCSGTMIALDSATVEASLAAEEQIEDRLAGLFGFALGAPSEEERKALGVDDGVLVRQVWRGYQAAQAGLTPGDVIVKIDGATVASTADLERMTLPVAREVFDLSVVRGGRLREVQIKARQQNAKAFGPSGVAWRHPPAGLPIRDVDPNGRLAHAGARAGDRLLRINGRPAENAAEVDQLLATPDKRIFAVFERNGRLWGALI
ncbi:MAG: PDZ domain-containing protein [Bryobacterales bacterium]